MIWKIALVVVIVLLASAGAWRLAVAPRLSPPPPPMPALARDLPRDASMAFSRRIAAAFPPGATEADLIATLRAQSFVIDAAHRTARFEWASFPCAAVLIVNWTASDGRITATEAAKRLICP